MGVGSDEVNGRTVLGVLPVKGGDESGWDRMPDSRMPGGTDYKTVTGADYSGLSPLVSRIDFVAQCDTFLRSKGPSERCHFAANDYCHRIRTGK